ncbi:hypothetical protein CVT26_005209 [Gymnopilus dilepis]|uniref:Uncharacterized protein n=1 Tax=Gymnopilus dilepis TaxID=231916 RepID=A0A409YVG5_9AGAR|nr:hypothetical protein CVT26_005209 [Gymnopilus dilepis]
MRMFIPIPYGSELAFSIMSSTQLVTAVDEFIKDIADLPTHQPLDHALEKAIRAERELRHLFASDPHNRLLQDLFIGLVDVLSLDPAIRRTRARLVNSKADLSGHHIFPLKATSRRGNLLPSTVTDLKSFREHWHVFTHGVLSKMTARDWENVIVAGGSVLACLAPPQRVIPPKELNELYQSENYATSDIDLFLWGLSPEEAKVKMESIYQAVCSASLWNVVCVRKANVVSIHTYYPNRPLQIILRLYQSPAEILAGFDVDAACCAYDGKTVWVNPRSLSAIIRQANTIDISRRSPSYEMRLAKYASRGFEVYIPSLERAKVNASLYDRYLPTWPRGLARLLVLERCSASNWHYCYLRFPKATVLKKRHRGELGLVAPPLDSPSNDAVTLTSSNYDRGIGVAKIPYGPTWTPQAIKDLVFKRDHSMNSPYSGHNTGHRHVVFAGTMQECLGSFCLTCPSLSANMSRDIYIRGPVTFMTTNPGQQLLSGSFRPIEFGDWTTEAYTTA